MTVPEGSSGAQAPPKIAIVGAGKVGATLGYTLIVERLAGQVVLVDIDADRARGEAMDIQHSLPFSAPTAVVAGDYRDCRGADVVVITAGAAQQAGQSRLSLASRNVDVYRSIVPKCAEVAGRAVFLVVTNPVDVLTYATIRLSGLPWQRVIGSGTVLDTARLRYELGANCGIDPRNVHAYVLGEHGDSEVPIWSLATVAGMPLRAYCQGCDRQCSGQDLSAIFERVRGAAYEIIGLKGATYYAIALGTARMIQAVLRDQKTLVTASVLLEGQYDIRETCLSLPVVLGAGGIRRVVAPPVADDEQKALRGSARRLRDTIERCGL